MISTNTIQPDGKCRWCGKYHGVQCPEVKALEFHQDGSIKRVEYRTAADYQRIDWGTFVVGDDGSRHTYVTATEIGQ